MSNEQDSLSVTYERVRRVFGPTKVARQMEAAFNRLLQRALERNAPNPVPEIEIEGIKELVTEYAWNPAFDEISGLSADRQDNDLAAKPEDR